MRTFAQIVGIHLALMVSVVAVDSQVVHADVIELMDQLPAVGPGTPQPCDPPTGDMPMAEGVAISPGKRVVLEGRVLFSKGPIDGLEVLACLQGGKKHESLVGLKSGNAQLVKAAFIAALGLGRDGQPGDEMTAIPGRGIPVGVMAVWQPDALLEPDKWVQLPASQLVRNRLTDQPYPALPWVWTGSQFQVIEQDVPGKGVVRQERFMLDVTRSVAVCYDEPHALFASPFPNAAEDQSFEVYSKLAPRQDSAIHLVFTACELPLMLELDATGELRHDGAVLDDPTLLQLLTQHYGEGATPAWSAVGVNARVPGPQGAGVSDAAVVATRARLLQAAIEARVWVAPMFLAPVG